MKKNIGLVGRQEPSKKKKCVVCSPFMKTPPRRRPCPLSCSVPLISIFRHDWDTHKGFHNLQHKADHLHTAGAQAIAEAARQNAFGHRVPENAAVDSQRERLRETSLPLLSNNKRKLENNIWNSESSKKRRVSSHENAIVDASSRLSVEKGHDPDIALGPGISKGSGLLMVSNYLATLSKPRRYDYKAWGRRRDVAVKKLAPLFPDIDFAAFCDEVNRIAIRNTDHGMKNLSAFELLAELKSLFPSLPSLVADLRLLFKCLCFDWLKTHSAYYDAIFDRKDIVAHRKLFCPLWRYLLNSPEVFLAVGDGSHQHQNERNSHGWIDKTKKNGDEVPSGAGLGARVNYWTFLTPFGVLEDKNKQSVTTITETGSIMDGDDIISFIEKGAKAMAEHPLAKRKIKVMSIDGAIINKMFPSTSIVPSNMNASDGGKNRVSMDSIGIAGLRRVLAAMGKDADADQLHVEDLRRLLWESDVVRAQLTAAEAKAAEYGVILIYTPKSPPRFSICEPFFRWQKRQLQNLFEVDLIRNKISETDSSFLISNINITNKAHLTKWLKNSLKYAEYFAKGGDENVRENDMTKVDLNKVGHHLPPLILVRNSQELSYYIHESNWVLIRGKHYPLEPAPWSASADWKRRLGEGS